MFFFFNLNYLTELILFGNCVDGSFSLSFELLSGFLCTIDNLLKSCFDFWCDFSSSFLQTGAQFCGFVNNGTQATFTNSLFFLNGENWFERIKYLKEFEYLMKHMNRFFVLTRNFSASPLNNSGFLAFNSSVTFVTWVVNSLTKSWALACNGWLCRNKKQNIYITILKKWEKLNKPTCSLRSATDERTVLSRAANWVLAFSHNSLSLETPTSFKNESWNWTTVSLANFNAVSHGFSVAGAGADAWAALGTWRP